MPGEGGGLTVEVDPAEVGLDAERLERIDRHFARYVDDGRLTGWLVTVARHGRVAKVSCCGQRSTDPARPVEADTLWRWYSMTKPITSVAAMMLYEEGAFNLRDPVGRFIPSLADPRVWVEGAAAAPVTRPAVEPIRIWHLLTHTAGFTYDFHQAHPVDEMYREVQATWGYPPTVDLAEAVDGWGGLPLLFEPGAEWNYSVATDVLGRLVEVLSGMPLDRFFAERIFGPLGMTETSFWVEPERAERLAALYGPDPADGRATEIGGRAALQPPSLLSGGGGLIGTAHDYHRFTEMLRRGGELDGVRLLGSRTLDLMTANHLPGNVDLETYGRPLFAETSYEGTGFGLGFAVTMDPAATRSANSVGSFYWGGAASTAFLVDPAEDLTVAFFTQLLPSSTHPIRTELRALVYQAIVD